MLLIGQCCVTKQIYIGFVVDERFGTERALSHLHTGQLHGVLLKVVAPEKDFSKA